MTTVLTVVICTHNPNPNYLDKVLSALKSQTLSKTQWELLLIDNHSDTDLASVIDLGWHSNARHVREETLGLTAARLCGFREATAEILVFVDDDNILDPDYLESVVKILRHDPQLGAIGGKSLPEFEVEPEAWVQDFSVCLALRDFGDEVQVYDFNAETHSSLQYPEFAPIGAGLVLRRQAAEVYVKRVSQDSTRLAFGRTGKQLISGEDNDINLTLLRAGWKVGYFPQLQLTHLISAPRLTKGYLGRLNYASSRSWIQVLNVHGICPWRKIPRWTILIRKIKAFLHFRAWCDPAAYVRWKGSCGMFDAMGGLPD